MKLYRVGFYYNGESMGFSFCTNKEDVAKEKRDYLDNHETEKSKVEIQVTPFDVVGTKAGIIEILKLYASHPDNG